MKNSSAAAAMPVPGVEDNSVHDIEFTVLFNGALLLLLLVLFEVWTGLEMILNVHFSCFTFCVFSSSPAQNFLSLDQDTCLIERVACEVD